LGWPIQVSECGGLDKMSAKGLRFRNCFYLRFAASESRHSCSLLICLKSLVLHWRCWFGQFVFHGLMYFSAQQCDPNNRCQIRTAIGVINVCLLWRFTVLVKARDRCFDLLDTRQRVTPDKEAGIVRVEIAWSQSKLNGRTHETKVNQMKWLSHDLGRVRLRWEQHCFYSSRTRLLQFLNRWDERVLHLLTYLCWCPTHLRFKCHCRLWIGDVLANCSACSKFVSSGSISSQWYCLNSEKCERIALTSYPHSHDCSNPMREIGNYRRSDISSSGELSEDWIHRHICWVH
jgi:hypothetical protein